MATVTSVRHAAEDRHSSPTSDSEAVLQQLEGILSGPSFCNSKRSTRFLRFIVEQSLLGHADQLKERMIGMEVFDRPPDYDVATDSIVRVAAGEVRRRLAQYYVENAHRDELRIRLEPGSYVPEFEPGPIADANEHSGAVISNAPDAVAENQPRRRSKKMLAAGALCVGLVTACAILFAYWSLRPTPVEQFWKPFFDQGSVLICLGDLSNTGAEHSVPGLAGIATGINSNDYLDLGDVQAMNRVSRILSRHGMEVVTANSATTTLADLRRQPVVLVGGSTNQWTMRSMPLLR